MFAAADSVDEAVDLANDSVYTLASAVWTKDIHVALDVASRIRTGTLIILTALTCSLDLLSPRNF